MTKILVRVLLLIAILALAKIFGFLLTPLILAGVLAVMIHPLAKRFEYNLKLGRSLGAAVAVLLTFAVLLLLAALVSNQFASIIATAPQYIDKVSALAINIQIYLATHLPPEVQQYLTNNYQLGQMLKQVLEQGVSFLASLLGSSADFVSNLLILPMYIFLILIYREYLVSFVYKLFADAPTEKVTKVLMGLRNVIHNYVKGTLIVMVIVGVMNSVGLWALGIPYAFFFGFFAAALLIIPYVGVLIGSSIPILVALVTKDSLFYPVACLVLFVVVQFLEGNFITPKITGSSVSLNPLVGITSLFFFGWLWGTTGVILAYPLTAIVKVICDNIQELNAFGYLLTDFDSLKARKGTV